jgi:hypothetical protein
MTVEQWERMLREEVALFAEVKPTRRINAEGLPRHHHTCRNGVWVKFG